MAGNTGPSVAILGGGVAGLTAAHELIERNFKVTVYERREQLGGKARSFGKPNSATGTRKDLPAEHGFRIIPSFYRHLPDTMKRIRSDDANYTVYDRLMPAREFGLAACNTKLVKLPTTISLAWRGFRRVSRQVLRGLITELQIEDADLTFFEARLFQVLASCMARRRDELEKIDWFDFVRADDPARSPNYRNFVGASLACGLAAVRPQRANSKVQGDLIIQLLLALLHPDTPAIRVLNGPTSEVWIEPWQEFLRNRGVTFHTGMCVTELHASDHVIHAVSAIDQNGQVTRIQADYYVLALPVEAAAKLLSAPESQQVMQLDPTLSNILTLQRHVDWMSGLQFYMRREVPILNGHILYIDSPWALTSVSQAQFWPPDKLKCYGNGDVKDILSVCLSNWHANGILFGRPASECTRDEIFREVWAQLEAGLNHDEVRIRECDVIDKILDPDVEDATPGVDGAQPSYRNLEPLLVAEVNSGPYRPGAATRIRNLVLAADYVQTNTQLPSMEAANEAARRAVNAIIDAAGVRARYCRIWSLEEPWIARLWRRFDANRYARGMLWRDSPWVLSAMSWLTLTLYHVFVRTCGKIRRTTPRKARERRR